MSLSFFSWLSGSRCKNQKKMSCFPKNARLPPFRGGNWLFSWLWFSVKTTCCHILSLFSTLMFDFLLNPAQFFLMEICLSRTKFLFITRTGGQINLALAKEETHARPNRVKNNNRRGDNGCQSVNMF